MSKIILERQEWTRINEILEKYKGINQCEIEVESSNGRIVQLIIPHVDFLDEPIHGKLVIEIIG